MLESLEAVAAGCVGFSHQESSWNRRNKTATLARISAMENERDLALEIIADCLPPGTTVGRAYYAGSPDMPPPPLPSWVRNLSKAADTTRWDRFYSGGCTASSSAIIDAASAVASGWTHSVLVVAAKVIDEPTFALFDAGGALTIRERPLPLTNLRAGGLLGEGAALILLESASGSDEDDRIRVSGWGRTGDGFHPYRPRPDGVGMSSAVSIGLKRAQLSPTGIEIVNAHGGGSVAGDASETAALTTVFGGNDIPPTHAIKGAIGNLLEASGAFELAFLAQSIENSVIARSPGATDESAMFHGLATDTIRRPLSGGLSINYASGGTNTAVVLRKHKNDASTPEAVKVHSGRVVARVGPSHSVPPVPGYWFSSAPAAIDDAISRCLSKAQVSAQVLGRTTVILLTPSGDIETKGEVVSRLAMNQRVPAPLFAQGAFMGIVGKTASEWGIRGAIQCHITKRKLGHPVIQRLRDEVAATDEALGVLIVRHGSSGGSSSLPDSFAECALYRYDYSGGEK